MRPRRPAPCPGPGPAALIGGPYGRPFGLLPGRLFGLLPGQSFGHLLGHLFGLLLALALLLPRLAVAQAVPVQGGVDLLLSQALVVRSEAEAFPDNTPARRVVLPDLWERSAGEDGPAWYRLQATLPEDTLRASGAGLLGLWLERACGRVEVRVNGSPLHAERRGSASRRCHEGLLLPLPARLLVPGLNQIDLRLDGQPLERVALSHRAAMLAPLRLAPHALLAELATAQNDQVGAVAVGLCAAAAAAGLAALALAWLSRLPYLAWFGGLALGWSVLALAFQFALPPMPGGWTDFAFCAATPPLVLAAMMFLLRYCGLSLPWLDTALAIQCVFIPITLAVALPDRLHSLALPWAAILLAEFVAVLAVFLHRAWRMSRPDFWVIGTGLALWAVATLPEALGLHQSPPLPGQYAVALALLAVFAGLGRRLHQLFQSALANGEHMRAQLEQRLEDVVAEAERSVEQAAEIKVEEVTSKERKRIAADLHDDLGAKLLTIVHTSDNERIATLAREALEEMRLSVRGLTGKPVQLGDSVGDWRSEAMTRLSHSGIELIWNVSDELLMSERKLSSRAYVQTTRILREAVSNMIKHSGASQCEIAIRLNDNDFEFSIIDNGKGIPMELDGRLDRGHGMSTMKTRAKQLHGQCLVESGPGFGTAIRLTLPI